ncbi:hypothetical protein CDO73_19340 [Saccharibacillus sp. O23]|uniref:hypothetical protein n=1 Tax=Saccharibacillus sp. O23 TaxID=2009338 RepID=UPI000B4E4E84|nr:hypothetical protein [Saccharibacillus sp. O23]OWR28043.1 hypothetical protein CDO73_19340 [Saccharibacillus sp. O23]
MNSFWKSLFARNLPAVYPASEAEIDVPLLDESLLESIKAAVDSYMQQASSTGSPSFSEIRQPGMVLETPALPPLSPVQLYGELEALLGLFLLMPGARAERACGEIELYMDKLRAAVRNRDSLS